MSSLERLITSWRASADLHTFRQGVTESEIEDFEILADWKLPAEWRELYLFTNGAYLFKENLRFYPLRQLLDESESCRDDDWPVPEELWLAGDNRQGDKFGLWLPTATADTSPVVRIGPNLVDYGIRGLMILGSSLSAFLLGETAFRLLRLARKIPRPRLPLQLWTSLRKYGRSFPMILARGLLAGGMRMARPGML